MEQTVAAPEGGQHSSRSQREAFVRISPFGRASTEISHLDLLCRDFDGASWVEALAESFFQRDAALSSGNLHYALQVAAGWHKATILWPQLTPEGGLHFTVFDGYCSVESRLARLGLQKYLEDPHNSASPLRLHGCCANVKVTSMLWDPGKGKLCLQTERLELISSFGASGKYGHPPILRSSLPPSVESIPVVRHYLSLHQAGGGFTEVSCEIDYGEGVPDARNIRNTENKGVEGCECKYNNEINAHQFRDRSLYYPTDGQNIEVPGREEKIHCKAGEEVMYQASCQNYQSARFSKESIDFLSWVRQLNARELDEVYHRMSYEGVDE